ncbi:MAG: aminoglycoside phosphotransferase family protein [Anaerolineae bacterium]|nr:aminoglycoside phosphotransferase family protein [Anaerolineae bacterium]
MTDLAFSHDILSQLTIAHIETDPGSLRFEPIRTGKHNQSYWVTCDQGHFALRIAPPDDVGFLFYEQLMMRQEPALHHLIRAQTHIPVAEVAGYDFSHTYIDRDYLLMTALSGTPLSDAHWMTHQHRQHTLYQVGEYLRELHTLTATGCLDTPTYGYLGAHHPMQPQAIWADAFEVMWNKLLDDVVACGSYSAREAQVFRDLYSDYRPYFDRPIANTLLHMDVWSQNILVDREGNVTGLVDFDRALWGDVEIEFAVLDYCGISEPAFWEGYGSARDTSPAAEIRRQFYLLYEVQKYMPIRIWRRNNDRTGAEKYKAHSFSLAASLLRQSRDIL